MTCKARRAARDVTPICEAATPPVVVFGDGVELGEVEGQRFRLWPRSGSYTRISLLKAVAWSNPCSYLEVHIIGVVVRSRRSVVTRLAADLLCNALAG